MNLNPICYFLVCCICLIQCKNQDGNKHEFPNQIFINTLPIDTIAKSEMNKITDYDTLLWQEITQLDNRILLDIKYASTDNFVKSQLYECSRCFLRPAVAKKIIQIQRELNKKGLGLKLFDCFRPRSVQQALWNKVPDARYVTPPQKGSIHNKGAAIDLTIVDSLGTDLDMGTPYDYFGIEAYHTYVPKDSSIIKNRSLLKSLMEKNGFRAIRTEWWHYSYIQDSFSFSDWSWPCKTSEIK